MKYAKYIKELFFIILAVPELSNENSILNKN